MDSNNSEIEQALKEFEEKSAGVPVGQPVQAPIAADEIPKMVALLMKWFHLEQRQAEYVLLGFVALAVLISLFLFFKDNSTTVPPINSITTEDVLPR